MSTVFSRRRKSPPPDATGTRLLLGQQLLDAGLISEEDISRVLEVQLTSTLRFGEVAVDLGLLSKQDLQVALARQYSYPCFLPQDGALSSALFTAGQPFGQRAESMRTLRSQLMLRWFGDRRKSIAITSAGLPEGSGVLAANLAIAFAQLGEKTLLIDANLREPVQHALFGIGGSQGLSSMLSGGCDLETILTPIPDFDNLSVICAGAAPPNPQELLSRVSFSYLVETAPAIFDIVIIDTPPILQYADAQVVSCLVGGCVVATQRHQTRVSDIEEIKRQLEGLRSEIVGAVVLD